MTCLNITSACNYCEFKINICQKLSRQVEKSDGYNNDLEIPSQCQAFHHIHCTPHPSDFSRRDFVSFRDLVMEIERHSSRQTFARGLGLSLDSGCTFLDIHSFDSSITPTVPVNAAIRTDSLALDCVCVSRHCVFVPVHSSNIFNGELLLGS